jgi:hypothetical protein
MGVSSFYVCVHVDVWVIWLSFDGIGRKIHEGMVSLVCSWIPNA